MTKFGLNGFLERTKGASLRYKLRELWWQLRYAWQRAWRGYDFTDVFELGYNFTAKMPVLLTEFLKNNVGLFYDTEADKQLDEEETNAVIKEMYQLHTRSLPQLWSWLKLGSRWRKSSFASTPSSHRERTFSCIPYNDFLYGNGISALQSERY